MPHQIVPPEPLLAPNGGKAWTYIPRWLRITLIAFFIAAAILIVYFLR